MAGGRPYGNLRTRFLVASQCTSFLALYEEPKRDSSVSPYQARRFVVSNLLNQSNGKLLFTRWKYTAAPICNFQFSFILKRGKSLINRYKSIAVDTYKVHHPVIFFLQ